MYTTEQGDLFISVSVAGRVKFGFDYTLIDFMDFFFFWSEGSLSE